MFGQVLQGKPVEPKAKPTKPQESDWDKMMGAERDAFVNDPEFKVYDSFPFDDEEDEETKPGLRKGRVSPDSPTRFQ